MMKNSILKNVTGLVFFGISVSLSSLARERDKLVV